MSKEQVIGKRYEKKCGGGYGGSFSPFISEKLCAISQPEWIKESEMDCVDWGFVLLDFFLVSFYSVRFMLE